MKGRDGVPRLSRQVPPGAVRPRAREPRQATPEGPAGAPSVPARAREPRADGPGGAREAIAGPF
jgi:hypothetical protein